MKSISSQKLVPILWFAAGFFLLALLLALVLLPEYPWVSGVVGGGFVVAVGFLIRENRKALRTKQAALGITSAVTSILVIAIIGVINFLAQRYPGKLDLTQNQLHSLSDQTVKVVRGLQKPIQAVLYQPKTQAGPIQSLLTHMKDLNPKFELEIVDPSREPTRAKQNGIKRLGTLQLITTLAQGGTKEEKIEEPSEEKITNGLIKLLKDKNPTLCNIIGHGERGLSSSEAEGFELAKKALTNQNYDIKEVQLSQETKLDPAQCSAVSILGPTRAFFEKEIALLDDYLNQGGRAVIALDLDLKGAENSAELLKLLAKWQIQAERALVVDPFARLAGSDAAVPVTRSYEKEHPITKEMQIQTYFPIARPLTIEKGAPSTLKLVSIVKTNDAAWGEKDFASLARGQVKNDAGTDLSGPVTVAVAAEGKLSASTAPADRKARLVVFGSTNFAANAYARFGANLDLFANSVSWILEDESLISIRSKEDTAGKIELSQKQGSLIFLVTVIILPVTIALAGIVIWVRRRKL